MKPKQADKYCNKLVAVTFKRDWFNEAVLSWVSWDEEYVGTLEHCPYKGQEKYYQLTSTDFLPTDRACWSANSMKRIRSLEESK